MSQDAPSQPRDEQNEPRVTQTADGAPAVHDPEVHAGGATLGGPGGNPQFKYDTERREAPLKDL